MPNPGLSRNCDRGANSDKATARLGGKAGASVEPGARRPARRTAKAAEEARVDDIGHRQ